MAIIKQIPNRPTSFKNLPAILNMKETCNLLGCTEENVSRMLKNGLIKGNKDGKKWYISKASIEAFVNGEAS